MPELSPNRANLASAVETGAQLFQPASPKKRGPGKEDGGRLYFVVNPNWHVRGPYTKDHKYTCLHLTILPSTPHAFLYIHIYRYRY